MRRSSSMFRPRLRSLTTSWRTMPSRSIRKVPRSATLSSREDTVVPRDLLGEVRDQRDVDGADATIVHWFVSPGNVGELRVDRDADDLAVALREFLDPVIEGEDLGRADEGEVERVEEQRHVLPAVSL